MATTNQTNKTPAVKTEKVKKAPVEAFVRISDNLKRLTLNRKLNEHELGEIAKLAEALKVFAR